MPQTSNSDYDAAMADQTKTLDWILAIAGWPTLYSVARSDYSLAGDLANFSSVKAWMNIPKGTGGKCKGRPEEGAVTIGALDIELLDMVADGVRHVTDLAARFAYLLDVKSGPETSLRNPLTSNATTVDVVDVAGFTVPGNIWIGQECIRVTGTSGSALTGYSFTGITRGYLLTDNVDHGSADSAGPRVYGYTPNLYRRPAYLYKGTQSLPLNKWLRAYGGPVSGITKYSGGVSLRVSQTTWETWDNGNRWIFQPKPITQFPGAHTTTDLLGQDYHVDIDKIPFTTLVNGHYVGRIGTEFFAVRAIV